ncbi:MAG: hypothetical protein ACLFPI_05265, partial [Desulfobacterales bacterium]
MRTLTLTLSCLLFLIFTLSPSCFAQSRDDGDGRSGQSSDIEDRLNKTDKDDAQQVSIDFNDVDINVFIKFISE